MTVKLAPLMTREGAAIPREDHRGRGGRVEFEGMLRPCRKGKRGSRIEARLAERAQGGWSPEAARDPGVWSVCL